MRFLMELTCLLHSTRQIVYQRMAVWFAMVCHQPTPGNCSMLATPGVVVLMACEDPSGNMTSPHRVVVTGPPIDGVPQFHTDFNTDVNASSQISFAADYSNSKEYFTDEGLGNFTDGLGDSIDEDLGNVTSNSIQKRLV